MKQVGLVRFVGVILETGLGANYSTVQRMAVAVICEGVIHRILDPHFAQCACLDYTVRTAYMEKTYIS